MLRCGCPVAGFCDQTIPSRSRTSAGSRPLDLRGEPLFRAGGTSAAGTGTYQLASRTWRVRRNLGPERLRQVDSVATSCRTRLSRDRQAGLGKIWSGDAHIHGPTISLTAKAMMRIATASGPLHATAFRARRSLPVWNAGAREPGARVPRQAGPGHVSSGGRMGFPVRGCC
jgi:hypothetical protein